MNSSRRDQWIEALRACFPMDYALEGYLAYLKKDEGGKQKYLNLAAGVTEPEEGASMEQVLRYLITQYTNDKITKMNWTKMNFTPKSVNTSQMAISTFSVPFFWSAWDIIRKM